MSENFQEQTLWILWSCSAWHFPLHFTLLQSWSGECGKQDKMQISVAVQVAPESKPEAVLGQLQCEVYPPLSLIHGGHHNLQKEQWHPAHLPYMTIHRGVGWVMFSKRGCDIQPTSHVWPSTRGWGGGHVLQKVLWHPNFVWTTKWPCSKFLLGAQTINGLHTTINKTINSCKFIQMPSVCFIVLMTDSKIG